jgi:hypothetical protein
MLDSMKRIVAAQPDALDALRSVIIGTRSSDPGSDEPHWERWVAPLGLSSEATQALVSSLRRLWPLPFADKPTLADLLLFLHTRLPQVRAQAQASGDSQCRRLCSLFELLVGMGLQGNSVFPQNPTHIAQQVQQALETPIRADPFFDVLLGLLISVDGQSYRSGFNFAQVTDLREIIQYERGRRNGSPEWCWKTKHKYDLFAAQVKNTPEFHEDWRLLSKNFELDRYRDSQGIIRRSLLVEGNWRKPSFSNPIAVYQFPITSGSVEGNWREPNLSDLRHEDNRFQVVFDFFCWKWFLYAMQGDEPLVQKLAVTLTPFGTQIFIPGFWSLDPARDINWAKVTRLHRARGTSKQGEKLAENQKAHKQLVKQIAKANQAAGQQKLRGKARYQYIKKSAGLVEAVDDAEIRRYLRRGRNSRP